MDNKALVRAYLRLRTARSELKAKYDEEDKKLKQKMERLEQTMAKALADANTESMRTEVGTFYRQVDITPRGDDWEAFYAWVREHDAFDALERRIKKTFIAEYMAEHEGGVPPGVSVFREYVIRVRKGE